MYSSCTVLTSALLLDVLKADKSAVQYLLLSTINFMLLYKNLCKFCCSLEISMRRVSGNLWMLQLLILWCSGDPDIKEFMAVYVKWSVNPGKRCAGRYVRWVCVLGVGDLHDLLYRREFFVNKFDIEYQPLAFECAERWLQHRVNCQKKFDVEFYRRLSFVVAHHKRLSS